MIFGNLNDVFDETESIYEAIHNNQKTMITEAKKPGKLSSLLQSLSKYGMSYSDDVYKNMVAIPADRNYMNPEDKMMLGATNIYNGWANKWTAKKEEEKTFAEKTLRQRVDILRKMAQQPELEDILDILTNEAVVRDAEEAYAATPFLDTAIVQELNSKAADEIRAAVDTNFYKIHMLLNFRRDAWSTFKRWLIDGVLAYEIVYDNLEHPKTITGIVAIDPTTLTKEVNDQGAVIWYQFKGVVGQERMLLDSQVIYIKYEDSGVVDRQSYLERLIRPFNIYRIVEQAQVIWTVTQASFKTMFTIPVGSMNKAKGMQTLNAAMNRYREDISFNAETGELKVNGRTNQPFNKEYWLPQNENGKPEIETLVDNGPQLSDNEQINHFLKNLYLLSKIPMSRFDSEAQSTWFGTDASQQLREEINFGRFVARLRTTFEEIILKPLRIQVALSIPDIKNDKRILDSISLRWNTYNQFQEMMEIEVDTKRVEFIQTMHDSLLIQNGDEEESYFSARFLIAKYLKMSDADLELNAKYKLAEKFKEKTPDEEEAEAGDEGDELNDEGNDESSETEGGDDIDSEMLGDVEPESSETTEA